jgi:four helix bundle protein
MQTLSDKKLDFTKSIYSIAFDMALQLSKLSEYFPQGGSKLLHHKLIHYSTNVCTKLAEAWHNRNDEQIFMEKLDKATLYISETQNQIEFAVNKGYLDTDTGTALYEEYNQILDKIAEVIKDPNNHKDFYKKDWAAELKYPESQ